MAAKNEKPEKSEKTEKTEKDSANPKLVESLEELENFFRVKRGRPIVKKTDEKKVKYNGKKHLNLNSVELPSHIKNRKTGADIPNATKRIDYIKWDDEIEKEIKKSNWGGARKGAGKKNNQDKKSKNIILNLNLSELKENTTLTLNISVNK
jgi:hypothetical protein